MEYRKFPNTDVTASLLGFGCMRLPMMKEGDKSVVNREASIAMIRSAIDRGVNYFDTAYGYLGKESEEVLGLALRDGYRERVTIATKSPPTLVNEYADLEKFLDEQLARLQVDCIDFYLLHGQTAERYERLREMGVRKFFDDMIRKGKIRYPGFSFHDNRAAFEKIVTDYTWGLAQVQMNFLDEHSQATLEAIQKHGANVGMVAMEPLRGGMLVNNVFNDVRAIYDSFPVQRRPIEWAFRWLYDKPEFATILSGMSAMEQLDENLAIFENATSGVLTKEESAMLERVRAAYKSRIRYGCTGCKYCMPCPAGVNIPQMLRALDELLMFERPEDFQGNYQYWTNFNANAGLCTECGKCEPLCPQGIEIREELKAIHAEYGA